MANPQLPIGQTEDDDNVFFDLLAAPFRGVEGAVQGVYNLADFVAFDVLPDYDEKFLGKSTTVAGSAVEGISQFMTGFVPIFGWAGRAGNLAKAGSLTQKALSGTVSRGAIAGAVTDFTMFNGQEARLSNFIQQYPELQNPVTEFLAHDEDEGEIEGRIKNVLEGLGLEFAALGFIKGLKSMKRGKKIRAEGGSPEEVAKGMQEEFGGGGVKLFGRSVVDDSDEGLVLGFRKIQGKDTKDPEFANKAQILLAEAIIKRGIKKGKTNEEIQKELASAGFMPVSTHADVEGVGLKEMAAVRFGQHYFTVGGGDRRHTDLVNKIIDQIREGGGLLDKVRTPRGADTTTPGKKDVVDDAPTPEIVYDDIAALSSKRLKEQYINKKLAIPVGPDGSFPKIETPEGYFKQGSVYRHKDDPNFKVAETDAEGIVKLAEDIANEAGGKGASELKRHMGPLSNPEDASKALIDFKEELAPIQKAQRDLLRQKYGDTVTVYRVEDPNYKPAPDRDVSSWSLEKKSVEDRLLVEGTVLKEKTVSVDDVQFVYNYRETEVLLRDDVPTKDVPDLMDDVSERMKEVEAPVSTLDEAIDARPPRKPFKTNLEAGRGLEGSRGAQYIKNRLQKKFTVKGADPDEVKDVETFIDTIGEDMFSDVSLSITSKITSKGRFNFANKLLEIRRSVVEGGSLSRTMVHELWHSLSRYLPKKDVDALLKQFNRERNKYIQSFGVVVKDVDKWDLQNIKLADQPQELKDFLNGKYNSKNYRFSEIDEYFAEEMTDAFLAKLDADAKLAPQGTFKRAAQDIAILLKHLFASVKSKLGIDQRQKIFNDFIKQRNVKKQRLGALDTTFLSKEMKDFADEVSPEHVGIAKAIARGETVTLPRFETTDQQHSFIEALRKEVESNPTTMERMKAEAEAGLPIDFGDNTITDRFKNMEQTVQNQRQVRLEATIYKKVGAGLVKKLHDIAKEYRASGGGDLVTAKLKNAFQEVVGFSEQYFRLGRETSLALVGRRQGMGRRKLGLSESEMKGQGIRKNFVNENGGMSVEKIVKAIEEGVDPNNFEAGINGMFSLSRKSQGRKFLDMPTEYWINSILSGPRTQVVNVMGNALTSVWSTLETAVGGVLTGNLEVTRQAFAAWADMSMFKEAASFAKNAAKSGENLLDPDARAFNEGRTDAITPEAFGKVEGDQGYEAIKHLGNFLRMPSRLLMTTDEFFKQLNYRRAARFKLAMDGIQQGISEPRQLAEYIEKGLEDVITAGGRHYSEESLIREGTKAAKDKGITDSAEEAEFVEQYVLENKKEGASALADFALEEARYLTFTKDLERGTLGSAIQGATQAWSPLRFVMPFVRTPTNILAFAFERTPGVFMPGVLKEERQRLLEGIKGSDPIAKSQAMGKLATSTVMAAVFLDTIVNNREYITGGGPKDEAEKKALRATGWQPYSFKIDGKYYSYQRLDPLGTILGVGADLVDQGIRAPRDFDQSGLDKVFSALTLTFVRNVTNKSYLSGVQMFTDAMADPERYGDRLLRNFGSSMLPYSGFLSQVQYGTGTQEAREVRSLADALLNKLPSGRDNLDPKRNILGESIMIENKPLIGAISPIAMSTEKNDPILTEMANLNHAFRPPPSTYGGLIDLLAFENDQGRTAHDRRQEKLQTVRIGGRTLRQALQRLIASRNYQRLPAQSEPGLPSPRVQKITSLLTKYRTKALNETMVEFPELSQYYDQVSRAKTQYRQGADHSSVLSLLTNN